MKKVIMLKKQEKGNASVGCALDLRESTAKQTKSNEENTVK